MISRASYRALFLTFGDKTLNRIASTTRKQIREIEAKLKRPMPEGTKVDYTIRAKRLKMKLSAVLELLEPETARNSSYRGLSNEQVSKQITNYYNR